MKTEESESEPLLDAALMPEDRPKGVRQTEMWSPPWKSGHFMAA